MYTSVYVLMRNFLIKKIFKRKILEYFFKISRSGDYPGGQVIRLVGNSRVTGSNFFCAII